MLLEVTKLGKRFGGFWALDSLDLQIQPGEIRAIIGPNGAGKSTLFNLVVGRYSPTTGDITYNGQSLLGLTPDERARRGIAIKFQITQVFESISVLDNIRLGLMGPGSTLRDLFRSKGPTMEKKAMDILDTIGLREKSHQYTNTLVHGERQWLEMGMALATNPKLLLLDEPTSGMGHDETAKTAELIKRLKGDLTIVVIEHDMEFVRSVADKITVLCNGRFLAEGTYEAIKSDERVVNAYLGKGR